MADLTKETVEELRGLLAKAAPGPWRLEEGRFIAAKERLVADCDYFHGPHSDANSALIVAMRNALPALLDLATASLAREGEDGELAALNNLLEMRTADISDLCAQRDEALALAYSRDPFDPTKNGPTYKDLEKAALELAREDTLASNERERSLSAQLAEAQELFDNAVEQIALLRESQVHKDLQAIMKAHNETLARATASESEAAALRERVGVLEKALEPFAKTAEYYEPNEGDDADHLWGENNLKIGDLRRARTALESPDNG